MRVTREHYVMTTTRTTESGTVTEDDEIVNGDYVRRFIAARTFFESINGTEVHTRIPGGGIRVVATSPDGEETRNTTFVPTDSASR